MELWDRPRSGGAVLALEAVKPCIAAFNRDPAARLVIHHDPAGEPALMAEELRAWLMALALDAERMELAGDGRSGALLLEIRAAKQRAFPVRRPSRSVLPGCKWRRVPGWTPT